MTAVEFHFNVPQRMAYACRLLRKAARARAPTVVGGDCGCLQALDRLLWTFEAQSFVPHCMADAPDHVRAASPILLACDPLAAGPRDVLVNLGEEVPQGFERFARVIDIAADDGDREAARARWRHYTRLGYDIVRRDLQRRSEP